MDYDGFVEHVRRDGERLASVAEGDLATPIPSCPGWRVRDLGVHVAQVSEHKVECIRVGHAPDPWPPEWPDADRPLWWYRDAHARLLGCSMRATRRRRRRRGGRPIRRSGSGRAGWRTKRRCTGSMQS